MYKPHYMIPFLKATKFTFQCFQPLLLLFSIYSYLLWLKSISNILLHIWSLYIFIEAIAYIIRKRCYNKSLSHVIYIIYHIISYSLLFYAYIILSDLASAVSLIFLAISTIILTLSIINI